MNLAKRTARSVRAGFTLIELLVVIAIITILVSLSVGAYNAMRRTQQDRRAEDVLSKLQMGLENQVKAIADEVRKEQREGSLEYTRLLAYCGNDADRAAALLLYCRLKQNFPAPADLDPNANMADGQPGFSLVDANNRVYANFPLPPAYQPLRGMNGTPQEKSAAVLYITLSQRTLAGNTFASDDATTGAQTDLPGGVRVYADPWGQPIGFRWVTQDEVNDLPGTAGVDPFDPSGKLIRPAWTNKAAAEASLGIMFNDPADPNPTPKNKHFTVYSSGLDKVATPNLSGDDIAGYRLRAIGAKGRDLQ